MQETSLYVTNYMEGFEFCMITIHIQHKHYTNSSQTILDYQIFLMFIKHYWVPKASSDGHP